MRLPWLTELRIRQEPQSRLSKQSGSATAASQTTSLCGRNAVQVSHRVPGRLNFEEMARHLGVMGKVSFNKFLLKFDVDDYEFTVFPDGRAVLCTEWFPVADTDQAARRAAELAEQGRCVWFGVGTRAEPLPGGQRGGVKDVTGIPGLWADIDVAHHAAHATLARASAVTTQRRASQPRIPRPASIA